MSFQCSVSRIDVILKLAKIVYWNAENRAIRSLSTVTKVPTYWRLGSDPAGPAVSSAAKIAMLEKQLAKKK